MRIPDPRDIIIKPVISEKSYGLLDQNKYTFLVHPEANKTQIKMAVEQIFDGRSPPSTRLTGKASASAGFGYGKRPDTKRAIVSLKDGDRIDIFESDLQPCRLRSIHT